MEKGLNGGLSYSNENLNNYETQKIKTLSDIDTSVFKRNLKEGMSGNDIVELNKFLLLETGMFKENELEGINIFDGKTTAMLYQYLKLKGGTGNLFIAGKQTFGFIRNDVLAYKKNSEKKQTKVEKSQGEKSKLTKLELAGLNTHLGEIKAVKKQTIGSVEVVKKETSGQIQGKNGIQLDQENIISNPKKESTNTDPEVIEKDLDEISNIINAFEGESLISSLGVDSVLSELKEPQDIENPENFEVDNNKSNSIDEIAPQDTDLNQENETQISEKEKTNLKINQATNGLEVSADLNKSNDSSAIIGIEATEDNLGLKSKLSQNENFEVSVSMIKDIENLSAGDLELETSLKMLYAGAKLGTYIGYKKGGEIEKFVISQGYKTKEGKVKLTLAFLEKMMEFNFGEYGNKDISMTQKAIGVDYTINLNQNSLFDELKTSVVYFDTNGENLGIIGSFITDSPTETKLTEVSAGVGGGQKLIAEFEAIKFVSDRLKLGLSGGVDMTKYDALFSDGSETKYGGRAGVNLDYLIGPYDKINTGFNWSQEGNDEARVRWDHIFEKYKSLSSFIEGSYINYSGDLDDETRAMLGLKYVFGGKNNTFLPFEDTANGDKGLSFSDLNPNEIANTDEMQVFRKGFGYKETIDKKTTSSMPILEEVTDTTIKTIPGSFTDPDGQRNVVVEIFTDSELKNSLGTSVNGDFSGLNEKTTYFLVTKAEAYNPITGEWEVKKSKALEVTTDKSDIPSTITPPTLSSKTTSSIEVNPGTFTDADGVQNVRVEIYSDAGLNNLVGTSVDGKFLLLNPNTSYYVIMKGEAKNATTGEWEEKSSSVLLEKTLNLPISSIAPVNYEGASIPDTKNTYYSGVVLEADRNIETIKELKISPGEIIISESDYEIIDGNKVRFSFTTPNVFAIFFELTAISENGTESKVSKRQTLPNG